MVVLATMLAWEQSILHRTFPIEVTTARPAHEGVKGSFSATPGPAPKALKFLQLLPIEGDEGPKGSGR